MFTNTLIIKLLGVFLGVLARTLLPWVRKLRRGKVTKFGPRYFYSAVGTLLLGIVITLLIFPTFQGGPADGHPEDWVKLFSLAFGFGFGWNAIVFEAGQWAGAFEDRPKPAAAKGGIS
jgi:cytochrome c biogenesis factor